jgi:hypothetical protein
MVHKNGGDGACVVEIKVSGKASEGLPVTGKQINVFARVVDTRDNSVVVDWTPIKATQISVTADATGFVRANLTTRVQHVENLTAILTGVTVSQLNLNGERQ